MQAREWIELVAQGIEILAVVIMASIILGGTARWLLHLSRKIDRPFDRFRVVLGRTLLIGLELLVAADIIRTVALDVTPKSLALLAGLVAVRTFLGWTLTVEVEGRWPWQPKESDPRPMQEAP